MSDIEIETDDEENSRFKSWVIPLPDFQLSHEPSRGKEDHRNFIGREEISQSFVDVLEKSSNQSGSYLVTGYRGVGKSSFVKHVLQRYAYGKTSVPRREKDSFIHISGFIFNLFFLQISRILTIWLHSFIYRAQADSKRKYNYAPIWRKVRQFIPRKSTSLFFIIAAFWGYIYGVWHIYTLSFFFVVPILFHFGLLRIHRPFFSLHSFIRRIFRPVVEVHINLGYEINNTQEVLFGIISLLRNKYQEVTSLRHISGITFFIFLLLMTTFLSFTIYKESLGYQAEASLVIELLRPTKIDGDKISLKGAKEIADMVSKVIPKDRISNSFKDSINQIVIDEFNSYENREEYKLIQAKKIQAFTKQQCQWREDDLTLSDYREYAHPFLRQTYCLASKLITGTADIFNNAMIKLNETGENKESTILVEYIKNTSLSKYLSDYFSSAIRTTPFGLLYFSFLWLSLYFILRWLLYHLGPFRVHNRLEELYLRTIATDNTESSITAQSLNIFFARRRQYHPLDIRQAENLLLDILECNRGLYWLFPKPDIIFVFDELDKIRPVGGEKNGTNNSRNYGLELGMSEMVRARKLEVEGLLGNLKNLITVAPCRFIFIAGQEMMGANLADRGETRHLFGSLFDEVLYVPSFMTDDSDDNNSDISSMVEQYVCRRLLRPYFAKGLHYLRARKKEDIDKSVIRNMVLDNYDCWTLRNYDFYLKEINYETNERIELISFLQDFIYFLTYRSAGNPKKLAVLFEEFVRPEPVELFIAGDNRQRRINPYHQSPPIPSDIQGVLRFDFDDQYRIKLISNTFIMLHGEKSRLIQAYGDKLSVSVFTILDYIFKFHSTGFCFRDLERMPDVLDIHRAPALPAIIDMVLKRLLHPYLRKMNNGIYDFRFLKHFQSEVIYLSQFSEDDLAAFNFSLDESIQIKQHYRQMLNEQMQVHEQSHKGIMFGSSGTPHVLPYLHTILGDLHFLDKEFDQARTEFRNALQYLEPSIRRLEVGEISNTEESANTQKPANGGELNNTETDKSIDSSNQQHPIQEDVNQILLYIRLLLKIGLLEEQRGVFDSATAVYYQATRVVDHVLEGDYGPFFIGPHLEQLNVLLQPYMCLAFLHAKRDPLPHTAEQVMKRNLEKLSGLLMLEHSVEGTEIISNYRFEHLLNYTEDNPWSYSSHTAGRYYPEPITLSIATKRMILAKFLIRQAEMRLMRSDFIGAMVSYINALRLLQVTLKTCEERQGLPYIYTIDECIGMAFIGLGDAASGYILYKEYKDEKIKKRLKIPSKVLGDLLKNSLEGNDDFSQYNIKEKIRKKINYLTKIPFDTNGHKFKSDEISNPWKIGVKALDYYVIAALSFMVSGNSADARLALWKLSYVLTVGFSYLDEKSLGENSSPCSNNELSWLFGEKYKKTRDAIENPLQRLSMRAFGFSYQAHIKRLEHLFKTDKEKDKLGKFDLGRRLCWSAEPLSQSATVMGRFWQAYWQGGDLSEEDFSIREMGPFPVNARIMAYYFKARWYLKKANDLFNTINHTPKYRDIIRHLTTSEVEKPDLRCVFEYVQGLEEEDPDDFKKQLIEILDCKVRALRMSVHCIEAASFFEGGEDTLIPPLGLVYYHVWATLNELPQKKIRELKIQSSFRKELRQYLQKDFCRTRAIVTLERMLERHNSGEAFFNHFKKKHYLYDDFSDNYTNVSWAVEYGLTPVAKKMLKILQRDPPLSHD